MIACLIRWSIANRFLVLLATALLSAWGVVALQRSVRRVGVHAVLGRRVRARDRCGLRPSQPRTLSLEGGA